MLDRWMDVAPVRSFVAGMIAWSVAIAFATALALPAGGHAAPPAQSPTDSACREAVLQLKAQYKFPGVVAGVWVPGKKPWTMAEGLANTDGTSLTLDHRFPIRSITKSYTVTLILKAVRNRMISLDDPIGKYVPGIPNGDRITLAQLAAMESGLMTYEDVATFFPLLQQDFARYWPPEELVQLGVSESPIFEPGAEYDYSNTNTILLGMVIEQVTGRSIAEMYQRWIFRPLGLRNTSYPNSATMPLPFATPYNVNPVSGAMDEMPVVNLSAIGASGGMVTTLDDLRRWGKALGTGQLIGRALQQTRLEHSRPVTGGPEYDRYGLGIGQLKGWWGHTGEGLGYEAATFCDPRTGTVIAVILNSSQATNVAAEVFKALADIVQPAAHPSSP